MCAFTCEASNPHWLKKVNVRGLSDGIQRAILEKVKGKLGYNEALKTFRS